MQVNHWMGCRIVSESPKNQEPFADPVVGKWAGAGQNEASHWTCRWGTNSEHPEDSVAVQ